MDLCSAENRSHLTLQFLRASIHGAAGRHIDRTIEALALAIDAQDHTTHDHLQRVRVYAMELA
jgi:response regulator RpfG family c-di-GMP phosphodiesterase